MFPNTIISEATDSNTDVNIFHKYMLLLKVKLYDLLQISLVTFPIREGWGHYTVIPPRSPMEEAV